ncbi:MAG: VTT domain-containing protein [Bryobacterales bacterium]|nr:VTT domain-containing protein [Bryobacterales bacterium]
MPDADSVKFLGLAAATLASEDLACVSAGLLIASGHMGWAAGIAACAAGIFVGDVAIYLAGRAFPADRMRWEPARRWFARYGDGAVFVSRFLPGFRVATYLAAGAMRMPFVKFAAYLAAAVAIWTPGLVGATAMLGSAPNLLWFALPAAAMVALRNTRWSRWEFWPAWAAYLPLIPYLFWLGVRHRSFTVFMKANPGMKNGGLVGESKSESLAHLHRGAPEYVAPFTLARNAAEATAAGHGYPLVLKPDVGERGKGVVIARSAGGVAAYFQTPRGATIAQEYVSGEEFGLFYQRHPRDSRGRLVSITRKTFPTVTGDGERTVEQLVRADERARFLLEAYRHACRTPFDSIPPAGQRVALVEIGSHCRGTIFLDGSALWTEALDRAVDRVAQAHPGFYFGRFDVRAASVEALQRGEFLVLELNGVGAEPAHIYDPAVSLSAAYRALLAHWREAFAIGSAARLLTPRFSGFRILTY